MRHILVWDCELQGWFCLLYMLGWPRYMYHGGTCCFMFSSLLHILCITLVLLCRRALIHSN